MAISEGTVLRVVASLLFPDNVIAQNVFYAVLTTAGSSSDEDDVVLDMGEWLENLYGDIILDVISGVVAGGVKVYEYDSVDDDWDEVGAGSWTDAFENADEMLPHGVAAVCHARTTDPDVHATKYLGGYGENICAASDLVAPSIARLVTFIASWTTQFVGTDTGATFTPGVWSPTNVNFFAFNGEGVANAQVGYQRRRKPGVGI